MPKAKSSIEIKNKRASFAYEFIETFQAGIVLSGSEIKSIRAGNRSYALAASEHQQPTGCYFEGMTFRGVNRLTVRRGKIVYEA